MTSQPITTAQRNFATICASLAMLTATAVYCEVPPPTEQNKDMPVFLKNGIPLEHTNLPRNQVLEYTQALTKLPTFTSCVTDPNEADGISSLNYSAITSLVDLEVCLFWVASNYQSIEPIKETLQRSGFRIDEPILYPKSAMLRFGYSEDGLQISASMPYSEVPTNMMSIPDLLFRPHALSIGILISHDLTPVNTSANFTRL